MEDKENGVIYVNTPFLKTVWFEVWVILLLGFVTGMFVYQMKEENPPSTLMEYMRTYVVPVLCLLACFILPLGVLRSFQRNFYTAIRINGEGIDLYYPIFFKKGYQSVVHYRRQTVKIKKYFKGAKYGLIVMILPDGKTKMIEVPPEAVDRIVRIFEVEKEKNESGGA